AFAEAFLVAEALVAARPAAALIAARARTAIATIAIATVARTAIALVAPLAPLLAWRPRLLALRSRLAFARRPAIAAAIALARETRTRPLALRRRGRARAIGRSGRRLAGGRRSFHRGALRPGFGMGRGTLMRLAAAPPPPTLVLGRRARLARQLGSGIGRGGSSLALALRRIGLRQRKDRPRAFGPRLGSGAELARAFRRCSAFGARRTRPATTAAPPPSMRRLRRARGLRRFGLRRVLRCGRRHSGRVGLRRWRHGRVVLRRHRANLARGGFARNRR